MLSNKENISKFEILPNEILLEIFQYLPSAYIFDTFYFLNKRYSSLLVSMRLRIDLLNVSKQIFDYYIYFLFPLASHCVISLRCEDLFDRFIYHIHLSNFTSLEYLTLINIKRSTLPYIIPHLNKFLNLIYLNLQLEIEPIHDALYFEEFMLSIERCILNFNNSRLIIQGDQCYSNLKYLTMSQYHIEDLLSFLHIYTPKLKNLTITFNDSYNSIEVLPTIDGKHNLESLTIKQCRIPFDRIEQRILISLSYLKILNINAIGIDYADGKRWERLLSSNFPYLRKFILHTTFPEEDAPTSTVRTELLKTFETKYFILHHFHFALVYNSSTSNIDLFSLPLIDTKFHANLYNTNIIKTIDDINIFDRVNDLTLFLTPTEENQQLPKSCFLNVKNLKLISRFRIHDRLPRTLFVDISNIVRFSKLESIEFIGIGFPSTNFIILDYTPNLHSLSLVFSQLILMTKDLTNQHICQQLTKLIKHLKITAIENLNNFGIFQRLPLVFCHLDTLSLYIRHSKDLYTLMILILKKMAPILNRLNLFIEDYIGNANEMKEFMTWLISYLHSNELEKVDVKQTDNQMSFERSFPDEIILEICCYLHPIDIVLSFAGLNYRLNQTINDYIRYLDLSSIISYKNYLYLLNSIFPIIWSSIESLKIHNCQVNCLTKLFFEHTEKTLPPNLKQLCLFNLNTEEIYNFIERLMNNTMIEQLTIEFTDPDHVVQQARYGYKIAQMLFLHHPTLKSIELCGEIIFDLSHLSFLSLSNNNDTESMNMIDTIRTSILRRLTIPIQSLSILHLLLIYQRDLEYLNIHIGDAKSSNDYMITPFPSLLNLREFHFRSDDLSIKLEHIYELLTYFPNLKSLSLNLITECRMFFDGNILQMLVNKFDSFEFSIARFFPPNLEERTLSTFYTPFWLENKKWFTQCYWNNDNDASDSDYFHIYSVPYPFSNFDIYKCTNENLILKENLKLFTKVKRLDLNETSDVNIIPFLKRCPHVHTICLNDIYDDEENYGTDEEEDITDQLNENISIHDNQSIATSTLTLPILSNLRFLILLALPEHDLEFFERLINVSSNLTCLSIFFDDLLEIVHTSKKSLCQTLQKRINQLEINLDYSWSLSDIQRDIPKILQIFSNIKCLTISLHLSQKRSSMIIQKILFYLFKYSQHLISIKIAGDLLCDFEQISKDGGIDLIKTWLIQSNNHRFSSIDYQKKNFYIDLNSSSISILL